MTAITIVMAVLTGGIYYKHLLNQCKLASLLAGSLAVMSVLVQQTREIMLETAPTVAAKLTVENFK